MVSEQTRKICEDYKIEIKEFKSTVGYQIDRFCNNNNAFFHFKRKATVDRLLKGQKEFQVVAQRNKEYQQRLGEEEKAKEKKRLAGHQRENVAAALEKGKRFHSMLNSSSQSQVELESEQHNLN